MFDLISVIIPIYNVEKYLPLCLDSIINQTYRNLEIILIDDGSTDRCGEICDKYAFCDSRIKVIHKENGGVSSARNIGKNCSTGKWLYFMDADDWIELNALELALHTVTSTNTCMCLWDYEAIFKKRVKYGQAIQSKQTIFRNLNDINIFMLFCGAMGACWNYIVKADLVRNIYFDERLCFREDEIFKLKIYAHISSFSYIPKVLYYYRRMVETSLVDNISMDSTLLKENTKIYNRTLEILNHYNYPVNSEIIANSKYLESHMNHINEIIGSSLSHNEKIKKYINYINSQEYNTAINNYDNRYYRIVNKFYLKFKKPRYWFMWLLFLIVKMKRRVF